jgi:purine-nucleoside phosphorylase
VNWVICIKNIGFEASVEARKLYNVEDDLKAKALGMIRVVDESGEGYLYPQEMFAPIAIHNSLEGQLLAA